MQKRTHPILRCTPRRAARAARWQGEARTVLKIPLFPHKASFKPFSRRLLRVNQHLAQQKINISLKYKLCSAHTPPFPLGKIAAEFLMAMRMNYLMYGEGVVVSG